MDTNSLNIYQKMLKITDELGTVAKNLSVPTGKSSGYKAVSEKDVLDAVKPLEAKYGVYSYACDRKVIDSGELVSTRKDFQTGEIKESKQMYLRLEIIYRFVNIDNPNEYIEIKSYGDGIDSGDKATGKAMTYADKYALLKAYKISTGDDPDAEASGEMKSYKDDKASEKQVAYIARFYKGDDLQKLLEKNNITKLEDLPKSKASQIISKLNEINKSKGDKQ